MGLDFGDLKWQALLQKHASGAQKGEKKGKLQIKLRKWGFEEELLQWLSNTNQGQDPTLFFFRYQLVEGIINLQFLLHTQISQKKKKKKRVKYFRNCGKTVRAEPVFHTNLTNGNIVTLSDTYLSFEIDIICLKLPCCPQKVFSIVFHCRVPLKLN